MGRSWDIKDVWYARDGQFVTLTNRPSDVPTWLHSSSSDVDSGTASDVADAPNVWCFWPDDRLCWVSSKPLNPGGTHKVELIRVRTCAVALLETVEASFGFDHIFGALPETPLPESISDALRYALGEVQNGGMTRELHFEWKLPQ